MEGEDSRPVKLTFYKLENTWENGLPKWSLFQKTEITTLTWNFYVYLELFVN